MIAGGGSGRLSRSSLKEFPKCVQECRSPLGRRTRPRRRNLAEQRAPCLSASCQRQAGSAGTDDGSYCHLASLRRQWISVPLSDSFASARSNGVSPSLVRAFGSAPASSNAPTTSG